MAVEARNRSLPRWFARIESGQLVLPRFQRFQAWSHGEIGDLLEAVLRQLPCGATLILEVGDEEPFISRRIQGAPEATERVTEHLLDGQQRLTALWRSLNDDYPDRTYFFRMETDEEHGGGQVARIHGQARWWRNGRRYPLWADDPAEVLNRGLIPIRLLRPTEAVSDTKNEIRDWCDTATGEDLAASRDVGDQVNELRQIVATYNIPFLSLPTGTPQDVALDVFIKMNTSSVRLTPFDIVVAQVEAATDQSLHDLVATLKAQVPKIDNYTDPSTLILNVASLRSDRAPTQASYFRLDLQNLVDAWDALADGIDWTVSILEEEMIFDEMRLPTVAILPVIAALHASVPEALDELGNAKALIRKYMWRAFLTSRYDNQAATRAFQDFRGLRSVLAGDASESVVPIFDEDLFPLPSKDELKRAGWPRTRETLARGILAVTLKGGAYDLADGTLASSRSLQGREYHHLFPDSLLTGKASLSKQDSFRALNCALFTWNTNRRISAKEPLQYLLEHTKRSQLGEQEIKLRLASQLIPHEALAVGSYDEIESGDQRSATIAADYDAFLSARAALLQEPIRLLCDGWRWPNLEK